MLRISTSRAFVGSPSKSGSAWKRNARDLTIVTAVLLVALVIHLTGSSPSSLLASAALSPVSLEEITVEAGPDVQSEPDRSEVLWLARAIYSETKQPQEQELVAWVIRNRLETGYRGKTSYRSVVLDPLQFSAFNPGSRVRKYYSSLQENSRATGWNAAIGIARRVATASPEARPFSPTTRHFYSERSMVGRKMPAWAVNKMPVKLPQVDERRFRFFAAVN